MKSIINFLIMTCALSLVLLSCGHETTEDAAPAFTLTSDEIVQAFLDDEQAANQKFNDQIVAISGPVMELSKENGKVTAIKLSSDEFNIVNATFQTPIEVDQIAGDQVDIKGVCSGFLGDATSMLPGGTVELKRAALITPTE